MTAPGTSAARTRLFELLEPAVVAMGYELADVEFTSRRGGGVLRVFIDSEDGITLDDCEAVSRQVSGVLDVEQPVRGDYDLEVSSPGLDRKLVKPGHYDRFAGSKVQGRFRQPIGGRRRFRGVLERREGERIWLTLDGETMAVSLVDIELIRLVPEI